MGNRSLDIITFGEILWDIIDNKSHLGGAPFNLAAHASLCGLNTAVISALGTDDLGERALACASELNINTSWIESNSAYPTGTVTVKLVDAMPEYTIHEQAAWDNIELSEQQLEQITAAQPKALCFGTLAQRSDRSRLTLYKVLQAMPASLKFFDVNLRQNYWDADIIANCLKHTNWLKVNDDEALLLNKLLFNTTGTDQEFAQKALEAFDLNGILITYGKKGCQVFDSTGTSVTSPAYEVEVLDTVGAGDAFSAAFLTALMQGQNIEQAATAGNIRGALVASKPGAIPEL